MPRSFIGALVRFRLIPLTMMLMVVMLGARVYDLVQGGTQLSDTLIASPAIAEDTEEASVEETAEEEAEEEGEKEVASLPDEPKDTALTTDEYLNSPEAKREFSQIELDILQSLGERRKELLKWEDEVRMKENLLEATEMRITKKIEEIKVLESTVKDLLGTYSEHEDGQIRSLVKIYESMKPKDAARIFDEVEMEVLLMVVDRMSERRAAPILAKMDPKKAKELTIELAERRKVLNDSKQALGGNAQ